VLTLVLGLVLSNAVAGIVRERSLTATEESTTQSVRFISGLVQNLAQQSPGETGLTVQLAQATDLAFKTLHDMQWYAGYEAYLPDGTTVYSDDRSLIGKRRSLPPGVRSAFAGTISRRSAAASSSEPHVRSMIATYGELMEFDEPVFGPDEKKPTAVLRAWIRYGHTAHAISADVKKVWTMLGLGLVIFYLFLFRLVASASRRLRRQSSSNRHLATHDSLTDLPNRSLLRDRCEQALAATARTGRHVGLMLLDLDRFKEVNDTLGHHYGDELLKQIADRLRAVLRPADTVGRLGGDEFVILLGDLTTPNDAWPVAERIMEAFSQAFQLDDVTLNVETSIGLAVAPEHGDDFDGLLQHADIAMYTAKEAQIGFAIYSCELNTHTTSRLQLLGDLRRAMVDTDQIVLHYQPKVNLESGQPTGVEALARWQHPVRGLLGPGEFIPIAEGTGIIRPLTRLVLRRALQQVAQWGAESQLTMAVNVSTRCLLDKDFVDTVAGLLAETGVSASRLELEITESAIMSDPERAIELLTQLASMGITLSIDDFGTGYSSMSYLKRLPVRQLKIDRTFITDMTSDASADAIVRSSLQLARNLGLSVVAEGVETAEVARRLQETGCQSAQGYFYARPMPAESLEPWLLSHRDAVTA
jgi:diguanylate cyclase (GGDEF)-like protein